MTLTLGVMGAGQEVGRSAFLLEDGKEKTLLDFGVKLSHERELHPLMDETEPKKLTRVILSHAHLDHSGFLPWLYKKGYDGKTTMTKPTRDLIQLLLADYLRIKGEKSEYSQVDIDKLLTHTNLLEYETQKNGVTFHEAGHILGSAVTKVETSKGNLLYTGDLNTDESRLLEGARMKGLRARYLIIESTYAAKKDRHPSLKDASKILVDIIKDTFARGGKVIIPTFAIGRGQEILFTLESHMRSGALEPCPIYLDGMVKKALRIYRHNAIYLKDEIKRRILTSEDDPFKSEYYKIPETRDKKDVIEQERAIILTTSGMLNGGPVMHYLKKMGNDEKNSLVLVGYQAENTRGRELLDGAKEITIDGEKYPINLKVFQAPFTAHSDQHELIEYVKSVEGLEKVIAVHGEHARPEEFAEAIQKACRKNRKGGFSSDVEVIAPRTGETIEL